MSRYRSRTESSNILARFSDNNVIKNLKLGSLSRQQHFFVAVMGNIFSTIKGNMASKPAYTYNFAIITQRNGVSKAKLGYKGRCVYMTSTDSVRHHRLSNIQDGGQWPQVVRNLDNPNIVVIPNDPKRLIQPLKLNGRYAVCFGLQGSPKSKPLSRIIIKSY